MRYIARAFLIASLLLPVRAVLAASPSIVISELQTGTSASASQEFVELYNPTASDVSLSGWILQYKSATSVDQPSSWSKKASLAGTIKSHGFYLIAPSSYLSQADSNLSTGLSGTGGHVRIVDGGGVVIDKLGWGETANAAETAPAAAPPADQSIERLPGRLIEDGGNAVDTDDNSKDFVIRTSPQPQSTKSAIEIPAAGNAMPDADQATDDPAPQPQNYQPMQITELLVNPAAPLSDTKDEFIELYNPNSTPLNLQGYTLKTGSNFHDYYVISALTVPPDGYVAIYASDSHLSLTNTGGAAELLDPNGQIISTTGTYQAAPEGQSWAQFDNGWQWTLQTTPGRPNVLVQPLVADDSSPLAAVSSAAKKASAAKSLSSTKATPKPAGTKVAKAPTTKTLAAKKLPEPVEAVASAPTTKWLLVGAVALTIGYAIYEFRYDLQNFYYLARRKFGVGKGDRPTT